MMCSDKSLVITVLLSWEVSGVQMSANEAHQILLREDPSVIVIHSLLRRKAALRVSGAPETPRLASVL